MVSRWPNSGILQDADAEPSYAEEEQRETSVSLMEKQMKMEQDVYRIWTWVLTSFWFGIFCRLFCARVLSTFEESSAACISDLSQQVSNGQYLEAIRLAERFILHAEVLFGTIDDLEHHFGRNNLKGDFKIQHLPNFVLSMTPVTCY
jgi:hypothetical protein